MPALNSSTSALINCYSESDFSLQARAKPTTVVIAPQGNNPFKGFAIAGVLSAPAASGDATLTLYETYGIPASGSGLMDSEQFSWAGKTATTLTGCVRGINNTNAAAHVVATGVCLPQNGQPVVLSGGQNNGAALYGPVHVQNPVDPYGSFSEVGSGTTPGAGFSGAVLNFGVNGVSPFFMRWNNAVSAFQLESDAVLLRMSHTGLSFFGGTPTTRPTVTGSRGGNAALASLLTALSNLGLVTDSSTA